MDLQNQLITRQTRRNIVYRTQQSDMAGIGTNGLLFVFKKSSETISISIVNIGMYSAIRYGGNRNKNGLLIVPSRKAVKKRLFLFLF